jgi:hypothetical protein
MPSVQRSSDIVESHSERAVMAGLAGIVALGIGTVLWIFRGDGMLSGLAIVLLLGGVIGVGYAIYCALQVRKVTSFNVECSYCHKKNSLLAAPESDFSCVHCHRMIPVQGGKALPVQEVRCGYCNELNFFSSKSQVLLCESCNHEIPIAREDGQVTHSRFAVQEETRQFELILIAHGPETQDLVQCLQHVLALNRNQVKDMLNELPVTLLTGIPKKKAEMLQAQISMHGGSTDARPIP